MKVLHMVMIQISLNIDQINEPTCHFPQAVRPAAGSAGTDLCDYCQLIPQGPKLHRINSRPQFCLTMNDES